MKNNKQNKRTFKDSAGKKQASLPLDFTKEESPQTEITEKENFEEEIHPEAEDIAEKEDIPHSGELEISPVSSEMSAQGSDIEKKAEMREDVENEKKVRVRNKTPKIVRKFVAKDFSPGHILQEARVHSGLSIDQAAQSIKIRKAFVEALERDDFDNLPPRVYVNAYMKALCSLYSIDKEQVFSTLKSMEGEEKREYTVPEEILQHLEEGKMTNPHEEKKVKRIIFISAMACAAVILGVFIFLKLLWTKIDSKAREEKMPPQTEESYRYLAQKTEQFIAHQSITMSELPVPEE